MSDEQLKDLFVCQRECADKMAAQERRTSDIHARLKGVEQRLTLIISMLSGMCAAVVAAVVAIFVK